MSSSNKMHIYDALLPSLGDTISRQDTPLSPSTRDTNGVAIGSPPRTISEASYPFISTRTRTPSFKFRFEQELEQMPSNNKIQKYDALTTTRPDNKLSYLLPSLGDTLSMQDTPLSTPTRDTNSMASSPIVPEVSSPFLSKQTLSSDYKFRFDDTPAHRDDIIHKLESKFRFDDTHRDHIIHKLEHEKNKSLLTSEEMSLILNSLGLEVENGERLPETTQSTASESSHSSLDVTNSHSSSFSECNSDRYAIPKPGENNDRYVSGMKQDERRVPSADISRGEAIASDHSSSRETIAEMSASFDDIAPLRRVELEVEEQGTEVTLISSVRLRLGSSSPSHSGVVRCHSSGDPIEHRIDVEVHKPKLSPRTLETPNVNVNVNNLDHNQKSKTSTWARSMCAFYSMENVANDVSDEIERPDAEQKAEARENNEHSRMHTIQFADALPQNPCLFSPETCCRGGCFDDTVIVHKRQTIEQGIACLLGNKGSLCDGWHAWSFSLDDEIMKILSSRHLALEPGTIQRVLRNRAGNLNERSQRIRRLREDMSPFHANDTRRSIKPDNFWGIKKAHSFSNEETPLDGHQSVSHTHTSITMIPTNAGTINTILDTVGACGDQVILGKDFSSIGPINEDLCYDSDPGEVINSDARKENRQSTTHDPLPNNAVRNPKAFTFDNIDQDSEKRSVKKHLKRRPGRHFDSFAANDSNAFNWYIDETAAKSMDEIMNKRMILIWHPTPDLSDNKSHPPMSVNAWIELGQQLRHTLIQPKFMWQNKHKVEKNSRYLGISNQNLHGVDLLDISRILNVIRVDRTMYPFAKPKSSFKVATFDRTFLFEASCEEERNRIVYGLKLVVARLGSKIIVNDDTVFDDFFAARGISVPGEEPVWTKIIKDEK